MKECYIDLAIQRLTGLKNNENCFVMSNKKGAELHFMIEALHFFQGFGKKLDFFSK